MSRELEPPSAPAEDPRLVQAVQEYLQALETGRRLDRQVFRERFPDLADSMAPYFDAVDLLQAAAPVLRSSLGAGPSLVTDGEPPAEALGDFRIVREVGRGGMGVVYEAIQRSLGRRVALKVLPFAATLDARQLQRFKNEAQAAAHLHHPNIVPVYAVGCERGVHYYAMQLIDGHNLATIIEEMRRHEAARRATVTAPQSAAETRPDLAAQLSTQRAQRAIDFFRTAARLLAQAADALDYAHGLGVVHRDVKPANLLVDEHGNIWITDFGLAQFHADGGLTQSGDLLGTLRYMSPEQSGGQRALIDQRTDVYSLGATLYELLTLRPIFDGTDRQILLRQILHDEPRPPRSLDRSMPPELETIVLKAVAKAPTERYATARELADDLRRFLEDRPIHARRPSLLEKATKWARRHRAVVAATLGALVLSVAGLSATTMVIAHAYDRERQKAHEADVQRARAQESFRQARRAVDEFARIGEEELAGNPATEGPRRRVLEAALSYYQDFVDQRRDDPSTRQELEASRAKVERLIAELATLMDAGKYDLLRQVVVQDELALSQDQRRSIVRMNQKWRAALRGPGRPGPGEREQRRMSLAHAQETDVAALLSPGQARRFRQIALQAEGPRAFLDPEVVTKLELTPAQREQIHAIAADAFVAGPCSPRLPPSAVDRADDGDGPPQEMGLPRVIALLTAEQVQRWKEMTGKPFTGRLQWPPLPSEPFGAPPPDQTRIRPKPIIPCMALLS